MTDERKPTATVIRFADRQGARIAKLSARRLARQQGPKSVKGGPPLKGTVARWPDKRTDDRGVS